MNNKEVKQEKKIILPSSLHCITTSTKYVLSYVQVKHCIQFATVSQDLARIENRKYKKKEKVKKKKQ